MALRADEIAPITLFAREIWRLIAAGIKKKMKRRYEMKRIVEKIKHIDHY